VRRTSKIAAVAAGLLTGAFAAWGGAGCSASAPGPQQPSVAACAEYGFQAIQHHVTVTRTPAPCRGLSREDINQAVALAIAETAGGTRVERRRRAAEVAPYLAHLISAPPAASAPAPGATWPGSSAPATVARRGNDRGLDLAALIAWLTAAGSGAYVLSGWLRHGGAARLRRRVAPAAVETGSPPVVVLGHFGLAVTGLILWVIYLITGWVPLAWAAVLVLLPVAGLGMALVVVGLPGLRRARAPAGRAKTRLSPLVIAGHGVLAALTILLVLLAALGAAST
jgi:manganese efflux pump family protein